MAPTNMRGCGTCVGKRGEIGCMFERRKMSVLALSETKMKGKSEMIFGRVRGRISGVMDGRGREGVALLLSEDMWGCVVERNEVSARVMWVKLRTENESWVFVSAYGPGSEKSEEERDFFFSDLNECV